MSLRRGLHSAGAGDPRLLGQHAGRGAGVHLPGGVRAEAVDLVKASSASSKFPPMLIFAFGIFLMFATTLLQVINQEQMTDGKNIKLKANVQSTGTYTHYRAFDR